MHTMRKFIVGPHERGLLFHDGQFQVLLHPGRHWFSVPRLRIRVENVSVRQPYFNHTDLAAIVVSGALDGLATVVKLNADQRALVWINGKLEMILRPGLHALWTINHD